MNEQAALQKPSRIRLPVALGAGVALVALLAFLALRPRIIEAYPDELAGIGIVVKSEAAGAVIGRVIDGGPAADAGLHEGDRIVAINGETTDGRTLASIVAQLRGKPGSEVILQVAGATGGSVVTVKRRTLARNGGGNYSAQ